MFGGGTFGDHAAVSLNGEYIILSLGKAIGVLSTSTGSKVQRLEAHTKTITGIALHPTNRDLVFTASSDGSLKLWNFKEGSLVQEAVSESPICDLIAPHGQSVLYVQLDKGPSSKSPAVVKSFDIEANKLEDKKPSYRLSSVETLAASSNGEFVGVTDNRKIGLWKSAWGCRLPLKLYHTKRLMCLAIDAAKDQAAAGDESGRIMLWHGIRRALSETRAKGSCEPCSCTVLHWHSQPVSCLTFSLDSAALLSGGHETVLVAWQLNSNAKRFLPRLGSQLKKIVPFANDGSRYLVIQKDNVARVVNYASMKVELSVRGMVAQPRDPPGSESPAPSAQLLPGGEILVLAAHNAVLQFYDVIRDKHLCELEVAARNTIGEAFSAGQVQNTTVEPTIQHFCFSSDAALLVTVDVQDSGGVNGRLAPNLKFWERRADSVASSSGPQYHLHTIVSEPHWTGFTGLAVHPSQRVVALTSTDGGLHLWERLGKPDSSRENVWRCRFLASYEGCPMHSVAFSEDGSLLAAGVGNCVTLWSPDSGALIATLPTPVPTWRHRVFFQLAFVPGTPFLAGAANGVENYFVVWNVLTLAIWWSLPVSVSALSVSQAGDVAIGFELALNRKDRQRKFPRGLVAQFKAANPEPTQVWYVPSSPAASLLYLLPDQGTQLQLSDLSDEAPPLLIVTKDRHFTTVGRHNRIGAQEQPEAMEIEVAKGSAFEGIFGEQYRQQGEAPIAEQESTSLLDSKKRITALFNGPTHALPALNSVADVFSDLLLSQTHS